MRLERGPEFYQKLSLKHALLSLWGSYGEIYGTWFIFIWLRIFYWNWTFVLLNDVEWIEDRSILLKHMSRTYYKWYFYLVILCTCLSSNHFFFELFMYESLNFDYRYCTSIWWWPLFYAEYMNNSLCDIFLTIVSANILYKMIIVKTNSLLIVIEWSLLPISFRNYCRLHISSLSQVYYD